MSHTTCTFGKRFYIHFILTYWRNLMDFQQTKPIRNIDKKERKKGDQYAASDSY